MISSLYWDGISSYCGWLTLLKVVSLPSLSIFYESHRFELQLAITHLLKVSFMSSKLRLSKLHHSYSPGVWSLEKQIPHLNYKLHYSKKNQPSYRTLVCSGLRKTRNSQAGATALCVSQWISDVRKPKGISRDLVMSYLQPNADDPVICENVSSSTNHVHSVAVLIVYEAVSPPWPQKFCAGHGRMVLYLTCLI